jgi:DtxR family Mn-dependent transcriptional regulator
MTLSEENYLKAIYHLTIVSNADVSTNSIAEMMETKSLVCDRYAQKLAEKKHYIKYQEFH